MHLKFECGCALFVWAGSPVAGEEPGIQSALSCCAKHEAPHQTLLELLPITLSDVMHPMYPMDPVPQEACGNCGGHLHTTFVNFQDIGIHANGKARIHECDVCESWHLADDHVGVAE
jgi:hypothetical protein